MSVLGKPVVRAAVYTRKSSDEGLDRWCQTNRLKYQKPEELVFYAAIRERHSVRAASRFSLKVLRVDSDLCELK